MENKHRKNYSESIQLSGFPLHWKNILYQQGVGEDESCSESNRKEGATQHTLEKTGPECKLKAWGVIILLKPTVWKRSCWSQWIVRVHTTTSKLYSVSRYRVCGKAWLANCLEPAWREREDCMTCSNILHSAESWFRANISVQWWLVALDLSLVECISPTRHSDTSKEQTIDLLKTLEHFSVSG